MSNPKATDLMSREEMIDILIEDRFWEWIYGRNTDGLEEALVTGWVGFEQYTDEELIEALEGVDIQECKRLIEINAGKRRPTTEEGSDPF